MKELILQLKAHPVVKAIPELKLIIKELEKSHKRSEKIDGQYHTVLSLMSDGVKYDDAMREAGLYDE